MTDPDYKFHNFHPVAANSLKTIFEKKGLPNTVVEIGVFSGVTTFSMAHHIAPHVPNYKHYAIDPFDISHDLDGKTIEQGYEFFKHNLEISPYKDNVIFMRQKSKDALYELYQKNVKADLIYIDGDHRASTVLEDLVLSYNILNSDGIILCDDAVCWTYEGVEFERSPLQDAPRLAVDAFIHCFWGKIRVFQLENNHQAAIVKI